MDFKQIQELIRMVGKSNISEFQYETGDYKIKIRTDSYNNGKNSVVMQAPAPVMQAAAPLPAAPIASAVAAATPAAPAANDESNFVVIKSPMVGTFYRSAGPGKEAFVKIGDSVSPGKVVCIVEAMKLFNEIEAEISGKIVKILLDDGSPLEYDQPIFLVDPKG
ncbi:MAG: acetyl-CoA carboxylase biotin carboxyl carrier protein [Bacteroidota bacterium]|jgi:acetyl-CoA carboxylase biotin carboxyl carrier protein